MTSAIATLTRVLLLYELPMFWLIASLNFIIPRSMPGDPLLALQDPDAAMFISDSHSRELVFRYYGLDRSLAEQYLNYLSRLLVGDLGWSTRFNAPVTTLILERLPWTLGLIVPALSISAVVAIWAGTEAAWSNGSRLDTLLVTIFGVIRIVPVYVLAILLIIVFSVILGIAPLGGARTPFARLDHWAQQVTDVLWHWWLPATTMTLELIGARLLLVRNSVVSVLAEPYMQVAAAKGLGERTMRYRHALPHAYLPFITGFATQAGIALGGSVFIESLFAYPGMGRLLLEGVAARDYALIQGVFLTVGFAIVSANRLVDLSASRLDPRLRPL